MKTKTCLWISVLFVGLILGCSVMGAPAADADGPDSKPQTGKPGGAETRSGLTETTGVEPPPSPPPPTPTPTPAAVLPLDGWLCFESNSDLWVMQPDGSQLQNITTSGSIWELSPRLSPDGGSILYTNIQGDLALINRAGTGGRTILKGAEAKYPSWLPDGQQILYIGFSFGAGDFVSSIHLFDLNSGRDDIIYEKTGAAIVSAVASPDGEKIVFAADGLYRINIDGVGLVKILAALPDQMIASLDWSPDGQKIAFHTTHGVMGGADSWAEYGDIYVVNADGSGLINLTRHAPDPTISLEPGKNIFGIGSNPRWANNRQIIFEYNEKSGTYECKPYRINSDGTALELLVDQQISGLDYQPAVP